jgi:hypothetical protein
VKVDDLQSSVEMSFSIVTSECLCHEPQHYCSEYILIMVIAACQTATVVFIYRKPLEREERHSTSSTCNGIEGRVGLHCLSRDESRREGA